MAHALAAFVAGVQGGIQFKNSLQDRKDDKARQKRMDELTFAREARAAESDNWNMGEMRRARGLEDAAVADAQAAYAATQASLDGTPGVAQPDLTTSTAGNPAPAAGQIPVSPEAQGVAAQLGLPVPDDRAAAVMQRTMPAAGLAARGQPTTPAVARPGPTQAAADKLAPPTDPALMSDEQLDAALRARLEPKKGPAQFEPLPQQQPVPFAEWRGMSPDQRRAMGLPATMLARDATGLFNDDTETTSRRTLREAREVSQRRTLERDAARPFSDAEVQEALTGIPAGPRPGSTSAPAPMGTAPGAPTKKNAAAMQAATGTAAVQSAPPAAQDAAQAGAAAATNGKGFTPGQPITPEQKKRGKTAFMDRYMEVGAPMVVEGMVKRGDIKGAMQFMSFIESAETKKSMETWANAAFAASVGDLDGFVDGVVDLYNDQGYFPDGTSIVKDQSKVVKDRDTGAPIGAMITFKDDKTGDTWEQIFTDDDLMALGITAFAPENAFEYWRQKQSDAASREKGLRDTQLDSNKAISEMAIKLMESAPIDAPLTFEDAQIKAAQALGLGSVAPAAPGGGPPPVAYRP